jgi:hypothetical protein
VWLTESPPQLSLNLNFLFFEISFDSIFFTTLGQIISNNFMTEADLLHIKISSQWDTPVHALEWLDLERLTVSTVSKDVEQVAFSNIACRNVKCYDHF